jgi:thiamine pyrophosphate-dependent acetolactate synthase large subunit-like protein
MPERGSDRFPVAIVGDGDYLMGVTALWTAVHYRVPLLVVVANNQSFCNDELHQERIARMRNRPVENRWVGIRMSDPPVDLATALCGAIEQVRGGTVCVVDVHVKPEYARAVSAWLLRTISND